MSTSIEEARQIDRTGKCNNEEPTIETCQHCPEINCEGRIKNRLEDQNEMIRNFLPI